MAYSHSGYPFFAKWDTTIGDILQVSIENHKNLIMKELSLIIYHLRLSTS